MSNVLFVPGGQTICLSPGGQTIFIHSRGTNIFHTQVGGTNIFTLRGDKHFCIEGGDKHFFVGGGVAYDDVDEETVASKANFLGSEANIFVSKASKLSAGARLFRGP